MKRFRLFGVSAKGEFGLIFEIKKPFPLKNIDYTEIEIIVKNLKYNFLPGIKFKNFLLFI